MHEDAEKVEGWRRSTGRQSSTGVEERMHQNYELAAVEAAAAAAEEEEGDEVAAASSESAAAVPFLNLFRISSSILPNRFPPLLTPVRASV